MNKKLLKGVGKQFKKLKAFSCKINSLFAQHRVLQTPKSVLVRVWGVSASVLRGVFLVKMESLFFIYNLFV